MKPLQRVESLWDLIQKLDLAETLTVISLLSNLQKKLELAWGVVKRKRSKPVVFGVEEWQDAIAASVHLGRVAQAVGILGVPKACKDFIDHVQTLNGTNGVLSEDFVYLGQKYLETMMTSFINAMSDMQVLMLSGPVIRLLGSENDPLFGTEVETAFPLAAEDIAGAGQALGFGLNTACVFHLMRAMERAVQMVAAQLGINHVERVWGNLLSDIGKAIEVLPKGAAKDQWSQVHVHLYHVKQAWRNDTMHPKKTYSEVEAKDVFDAVGSFMRHLAPLVEQL